MSKPSAADIENLAALFQQSDWTQMRLKMDGLEVFWSNDPGAPLTGDIVSNSGAALEIPAGMDAVRAPHLGTFHAAPQAGAAPYVEVGQAVATDTAVCRIEVLGAFTPLVAGVSGTVRQICVVDAHLVEFDQPLVIIDPAN